MLSNNPTHRIVSILGAVVTLFIVILIFTDPIPQDPAYHQFADHRSWLRTPNFFDVFSNLPFAVVAIMGFNLCRSHQLPLPWPVFFGGLLLVAAGSGYYHWSPDNESLVWDRLPMTISFMSLFVALLGESMTLRHEKAILALAIIIGIASVVYWRYTDDLRFYGFIQFGVLAALPLIIYQHRRADYRYLFYGLVSYIMAKFFELNDRVVFDASAHLFSGHTIKHLLAATACHFVYRMLHERTAAIE